MTTRTPTNYTGARSHLRVLEGGLSSGAWQEDDLASVWDHDRLDQEMAAAALMCDLLQEAGLRIAFDEDPAGGRVRASVIDAGGGARRELSLAHVIDPASLDPYWEEAR
jgi:hypothetical protein